MKKNYLNYKDTELFFKALIPNKYLSNSDSFGFWNSDCNSLFDVLIKYNNEFKNNIDNVKKIKKNILTTLALAKEFENKIDDEFVLDLFLSTKSNIRITKTESRNILLENILKNESFSLENFIFFKEFVKKNKNNSGAILTICLNVFSQKGFNLFNKENIPFTKEEFIDFCFYGENVEKTMVKRIKCVEKFFELNEDDESIILKKLKNNFTPFGKSYLRKNFKTFKEDINMFEEESLNLKIINFNSIAYVESIMDSISNISRSDYANIHSTLLNKASNEINNKVIENCLLKYLKKDDFFINRNMPSKDSFVSNYIFFKNKSDEDKVNKACLDFQYQLTSLQKHFSSNMNLENFYEKWDNWEKIMSFVLLDSKLKIKEENIKQLKI